MNALQAAIEKLDRRDPKLAAVRKVERHAAKQRHQLAKHPEIVAELLSMAVEVLNRDDQDLRLKELCLAILASVSEIPSLNDQIVSAMGELTAVYVGPQPKPLLSLSGHIRFESFFESTIDIDANVAKNLYLHLLTIFFRITNYEFQVRPSFPLAASPKLMISQAKDLLEMTGDLNRAADALVAVFDHLNSPAAVHVAAADVLLQLTVPDTYFDEEDSLVRHPADILSYFVPALAAHGR